MAALVDLEAQLRTGNRLGVDTSLVSRWESGRRRPDIFYAVRLCMIHQLTADRLGFDHLSNRPRFQTALRELRERSARSSQANPNPSRSDQSPQTGAGNRRLAALLDLTPDRPLDSFEGFLSQIERQVSDQPSQMLLPLAAACLRLLQSEEFVDLTSNERLTRRRFLSRAAILMGRLNYQLNNRGETHRYLKLAEEMARLAGDGPLLACALIERSRTHSRVSFNNPLYDSDRALELLDQAEAIVGASEPPLVAWLRGRRALELAAKGRAAQAEQELDRVSSLPVSEGHDSSFSASLWNDGALVSYQGVVSLRLGRHDEAASLLEKAVRASHSASYRAVNMMDLAVAYARLGLTERSCQLLDEALQLCVQRQNWARIQGIAGRRRRYLKGGSLRIRQLDEQLRQLT